MDLGSREWQRGKINVGMQLWLEGQLCCSFLLNETMLVVTALEHTRAGSTCRALVTMVTDRDLFQTSPLLALQY